MWDQFIIVSPVRSLPGSRPVLCQVFLRHPALIALQGITNPLAPLGSSPNHTERSFYDANCNAPGSKGKLYFNSGYPNDKLNFNSSYLIYLSNCNTLPANTSSDQRSLHNVF
ncbi:hypothetical protein ACLOJK_026995 [Asimina triloba]